MLSRVRSPIPRAARVPVERWLGAVGVKLGPVFLALGFTSAGNRLGVRFGWRWL